jgi:hypothetical protein
MQTRHVAPHVTNDCLVAFGYRHPAPTEQRQMNRVCHYPFKDGSLTLHFGCRVATNDRCDFPPLSIRASLARRKIISNSSPSL